MLQFTTTTVINSLGADGFNNLLDSSEVFGLTKGPQLKKDGIISVVRAPYILKQKDKIVIKPAAINASNIPNGNIGRIMIYATSVGNADPMFSNNYVTNGCPIFFEFKSGDNVDNIVSKAKKYMNAYSGGYEIVSIKKNSSSNIEIEAANEYIRFQVVKIQKMDPTLNGASFVDVIKVDGKENINSDVTIASGNEGKGTYEQIMKDLRIPTSANSYYKEMLDEIPEVGSNYEQFTITYCIDRGVMGLGAVGATTTSQTTHVFFVKNTNDSKAALSGKDNPAYQFANKLNTVTGIDVTAAFTENYTEGKPTTATSTSTGVSS